MAACTGSRAADAAGAVVVANERLSNTTMSQLETTAIEAAGCRVHETRLANGLQVLILERHTDPVVASMCWYKVGSKSERTEEAGLSHFLEHMMFKGTPRFGKGMVDREITRLGGSNNAFTSYDYTAYWFELASDRWEHALDLEADRMRHLLLDPEEFESEKAVVLEELSMGLDDPWRRLSHEANPMVWGRHPYGRPIIGYRDVLGRATPDDMRRFYQRYYHPGNATVVVSGDVQPEAALAAIEARYGDLPAGPAWDESDPWRPEVEAPAGPRRVQLTWDDPGKRLLLAWPTAAVATETDIACDVFSTLLASGRLSRLYRRLVLDRQLATFISPYNDARQEGGCLWIYAEANQGVAMDDLEAAIRAEVEALRSEPPSTEEIERAQNILAAGERTGTETVSDLAEHVGAYAIDCRWQTAFELTEMRQRVDADALLAFAQEYLDPNRCVAATSLPEAS